MRFVKRVSAPDTYDVYRPEPGVYPGLWIGAVRRTAAGWMPFMPATPTTFPTQKAAGEWIAAQQTAGAA